MSKRLWSAKLLHNAKRCYVYSYGIGETAEGGKLTISKRLLDAPVEDLLGAFLEGEVAVEPAPDGGKPLNLGGCMVDTPALTLFSAILDHYEAHREMPLFITVRE